MIAAYVRVDPSDPVPDKVDFLLDFFGDGDSRSTVELGRGFFGEGTPIPASVSEIFALAAATYCLDKVVARDVSPDGWTRTFSLNFPGSTEGWESPHLQASLSFLTGDRWSFSTRDQPALPLSHRIEPPADVVCLFSGGLDSLVGAVQLLEAGYVVRLVAHHETGLAPGRQRELANALSAHYGADRVALSQMFLRPSPPWGGQYASLPSR